MQVSVKGIDTGNHAQNCVYCKLICFLFFFFFNLSSFREAYKGEILCPSPQTLYRVPLAWIMSLLKMGDGLTGAQLISIGEVIHFDMGSNVIQLMQLLYHALFVKPILLHLSGSAGYVFEVINKGNAIKKKKKKTQQPTCQFL